MASSPTHFSSTSPLQESEGILSDDSGVDLKSRDNLGSSASAGDTNNRRNKRKSSEPKKRKDVLLMRRFRWDTDEEDAGQAADDVFERPSSGDSGCPLEEEDPPPPEKKKRTPRQWRRHNKEEGVEEDPAFRQSVICKNECPAAATPCSSSSVHHHPEYDSSNELEGQPELDADQSSRSRTSGSRPPRNYKSMSRQRRIEANARERTRVHTISAAFESLRRAVPAYAHNQKLSKLAILRIASAYIVALACLNGGGNTHQEDSSSMAECVEQCTRTIQAEGRSRRRTFKD